MKPRIIDAEFTMLEKQPSQPRRMSLGEVWYRFCIAIISLAVLVVAVPLLIGVLFVGFEFFKAFFTT